MIFFGCGGLVEILVFVTANTGDFALSVRGVGFDDADSDGGDE